MTAKHSSSAFLQKEGYGESRILPSTLFRGAAQGATSATIAVVLRIDIAAIEVQVVGIRWIVHSTRPEVPVRSLIVQRARSIVVASVGKVEGS